MTSTRFARRGSGSRAMQEELLADLATIQFRHLPGTGHLRAKAIAQIAGKVLYLAGEGRTTDQLVRDAGSMLNIPRLPAMDLEAGLKELRGAGLVEKPTTH